MSRFVDLYIDPCVAGYECISSPRWSTDLVMVDSGSESANQRWADVLHKFTLPSLSREMLLYNAIKNHWMAMRGPFYIWPWRDPLDFASVDLVAPNAAPAIASTDEYLGTGDGYNANFQLYRTYKRENTGSPTTLTQSYRRKIELPIVSSVLLKGEALGSPSDPLPSVLTISRPGGVVTFASPPPAGMLLTAGFLFDVPVRFENDESFDGFVRSLTLAGTADLTLIETRIC